MSAAILKSLVVVVAAALPALTFAQPVRLAAPGLTGVNLDEAIVEFYSEHFAQQVALRGVPVVTAAEIATLIGFERQRQLVGCGDESGACLAEIAGALGVEALITGSLARFGGTLQANLKVIRATDARPLSLISRTANTEDALFQALSDAAEVAAREVLEALRPGQKATLDTARAGLGPLTYRVIRNNVLRMELATLIAGAWAVEYERVFTDFFALAVRPAFLNLNIPLDPPEEDIDTRGVDLAFGPRLYPLRRAPGGFWFGAEVRAAYGWQGVGSGFHAGFGLATGWSYVGDVLPFVISVSAAAAYFPTGSSPVAAPVDARVSIAIGWAF